MGERKGCRKEQRTDSVMVGSPKVDVNSIKNAKKRQAPRDAVDDDLLASGGELVDDRSKEE